jgi:hypothetical protein
MVSDKQLIANRENGKLGGVKTDAGKKVVRYNAVSHGMLSRELFLKGENEAELVALRNNLMREYNPQGEVETFFVERIVCCMWKMKRAQGVESRLLTNFLAENGRRITNSNWFGINADIDDRLQCLSRYETTEERRMYKTMGELERLRRSRQGEILPVSATVDVNVAVDGVNNLKQLERVINHEASEAAGNSISQAVSQV